MRKFIWISALILMPLGAVAGVLAYSWQQATYLPDWYQTEGASPFRSLSKVAIALEPQSRSQQSSRPESLESPLSLPSSANAAILPATLPEPFAVMPNDARVNDPVTLVFDRAKAEAWLQATVTRHLAKSNIAPAILGFQVNLDKDRLRGGAVIRIADLPLDQLNPQEQRLVQQTMELLPALRHRQLYIGVEGQPIVQGGRLRFDEDAQVRLGNLKLPLRDAAARLGVSQSDLERQFSLELPNNQVEVEQVSIEKDRVLIRGRKR